MSYLTRKTGGRYHVRVRVPVDLINILDRKEIRRTLGTSNARTARMLAGPVAAAIMGALERVRMSGDKDRLEEEVASVTKSYVEGMEAVVRAQSAMLDAAQMLDVIKSGQARIREERLIGTMAVLAQGVGTQSAAPDPFAGLHPDSCRPLDELLTDFLRDNPQSPKRLAEYEAELGRWRRAVGDKAVALIDAMDVAAYHDLLLQEVRPRKGGEIASHDTQHKALSAIRMMLGWACSPTVARRKVGDNPAAMVRPKGVSRKAKNAIKRRSWKAEELKAIFAAPVYTGCLNDLHCLQAGTHDLWWSGRYWLPLAALMTGARIGEIAGLRVGDVSVTDGITYLSVTTETTDEDDDEDKERTVKTESSIRLLPVHPELEKLGFLEHIAGVSKGKKPSDPLFEKRDYTKFYNNKDRFFDKVGVKSDLTSFHSFRHTFKDMLRVLRDSDLRDRLMGHAPRSVGESYGSPLTPDEVRDFVEKVRCPIDLSHLYPGNRRVGV